MMKNNFKNAILLFITIVAVFGFQINANAESKQGEYGFITTNETTMTLRHDQKYGNSYGISILKNGNVSVSGEKLPYKFYYDNSRAVSLNKWFTAYCLDPAVWSTTDTVVAKRILFGEGGESLLIRSYDTALMYALTYNTDSYMAKSIAIRAITSLYGNNVVNGNNAVSLDMPAASYELYVAFFGQALEWVKSSANESYQTLASILSNEHFNTIDKLEAGSLYINGSRVKNTTYHYKDYTFSAGETKTIAENIFKGALKEAASYVESNKDGGASISVNQSLVGVKSPNVVTDTTEIISYQKTYDFTLKNFHQDENAYFSIDSLSFDKGFQSVGAKTEPYVIKININGYEIFNRATKVGTFDMQTNILASEAVKRLNLDYSKDIKISVTIEIVANYKVKNSWENHVTCATQPMAYTLNYSYQDTSVMNQYREYVAAIWGDAKTGLSQRFLTIEKIKNEDNGYLKSSVKENINLLNCGCETLAKACDESIKKYGTKNTEECRIYEAECNGACSIAKSLCEYNPYVNASSCTYYDEVCTSSTCSTTVSNKFECCDLEGQLVVVDQSKIPNLEINGPSTKACFVDKVNNLKDTTDTSYKGEGYKNAKVVDEMDNSYTLMSNKYCSVSCKEDYVFNLPTSKVVNAGRYFTFDAKISGTKTCVTNEIDIGQFNSDVTQIVAEMQNAYNNYMKYKTAIEFYSSRANYTYDQNKYANYTGACGSCSYSGSKKGLVTSISYNTYQFYVTDSGSLKSVSLNSGSSTYNFTNDYQFSSWEQVRDYIEKSKLPSTNQVKMNDGGSSGYCSSCSTNPPKSRGVSATEGSYTNALATSLNAYKEYYKRLYESLSETLKNRQNDYTNCSGYWTGTTIKFDPEVTYNYDESNYMDMIKGVGKMDETLLSGGSDVLDYCKDGINSRYQCVGATGRGERQVNSIACDLDNGRCYTTSITLPSVKYVKKTSYRSALYKPSTLFYNVYPSGSITTDSSVDNAVALENKLPVSLDTSRGIWDYQVKVSNIGEFYSENRVGRLAGDSSRAVLSTKDLKNDTNYQNNAIQYNCSYLVNMGHIEDEMLACNFGCDGACDFECVGPGCQSSCSNGACEFECVGLGCVYNKEDGNYMYEKQITLNNVFPEGTSSYNWDKEKNEKAQKALEEIETKANSIYNETPILSVTIDPNTRKAITQYNHDNDDDYANQTMRCYTLEKYENIACLSTFIDDLLEGKVSRMNVDAVNYENSKIANNANRSINQYFETWSGIKDANSMLGPSWK